MFNLIDDQIAAYNAIRHKAKALAQTTKKSVVIVKGGPGTGKSVIALEVMGEMMRQGRTVFHATGSSAFTNTLRKIVGSRASRLFKFFNSFATTEPDSIDILVCTKLTESGKLATVDTLDAKLGPTFHKSMNCYASQS